MKVKYNPDTEIAGMEDFRFERVVWQDEDQTPINPDNFNQDEDDYYVGDDHEMISEFFKVFSERFKNDFVHQKRNITYNELRWIISYLYLYYDMSFFFKMLGIEKDRKEFMTRVETTPHEKFEPELKSRELEFIFTLIEIERKQKRSIRDSIELLEISKFEHIIETRYLIKNKLKI